MITLSDAVVTTLGEDVLDLVQVDRATRLAPPRGTQPLSPTSSASRRSTCPDSRPAARHIGTRGGPSQGVQLPGACHSLTPTAGFKTCQSKADTPTVRTGTGGV